MTTIFVYTYDDNDWTWCAHECGLATNLDTPIGQDNKRIVVFQCTDDELKLYPGQLRIKITEEDIKRFTKNYFHDDDFFRGESAYNPKVTNNYINFESGDFYKRLKNTISKELSPQTSVPLISKQELMNKESLSPMGELEDPAEVVVKSTQPIERDYEFAVRVLSNIKSTVKYRYYFDNDQNNIIFIARVIQTLAIAGIESLKDPSDRKKCMKEHVTDIDSNLESIREGLSVYFLSDSGPQEFCIYNAKAKVEAQCYIRYLQDAKDGFLRMYSGQAATDFYAQLRRENTNLSDSEMSCVFRNTRSVMLYNDEHKAFRIRLQNEICEHFSDELQEKVKEICFLGSES